MVHEQFTISFQGAEADDIYETLILLEIELNDSTPATFRMQLGIYPQSDGSWSLIDEDRFQVWTEVSILIGFVETSVDEVFAGYITQVTPWFDPDPSRCYLEIIGTDKSILMDREEKLKAWPNKKDSDIATEIFSTYGLSPNVSDTSIVHDEAVSTIIQRETDFQFLNRLALRNGYALYVEGAQAFFNSVPLDVTPQPVLAAHFGEETNLRMFSPMVDSLRPTAVSMLQVDRVAKEVLTAELTSSNQDALGSQTSTDLTPAGIDSARFFVSKNAATSTPEMEILCQGLFQEGAWFVSAEGETEPTYEHVLRPRKLVTIKGVGERYSGNYYVSFVRHAYTKEGYTQYFRAQRDGLLPTGFEDFSSTNGLAGGLL